jgi:uncharacterized damage-inducible protein DinB
VSELDAIRTFFRFNSRVRQHYLETILALPPAERLKDRGASYPSLQEIFVHVLDGIHWWVEYVPQDRVADAKELPARDLSPELLRAETDTADRLAREYVGRLTEADLTRDMVCHFPGEGGSKEARFPIGDVLWHLVEEELQHRGELNALLWQMNVDPPIAQIDDWNASKLSVAAGTRASRKNQARKARPTSSEEQITSGGAKHGRASVEGRGDRAFSRRPTSHRASAS